MMAIRIGKPTRTTPESWLLMQVKLGLWREAGKPAQVEVLRGWGMFEGAAVWGAGREWLEGECLQGQKGGELLVLDEPALIEAGE